MPQIARRRRAAASRSSGPGPRASRARSSSRAPATTSSLFEKADRIGGLLRYGIPDFKMEKDLIDRRMAQMSPRASSSAPACTWACDVDRRGAARGLRRGGAHRRRREAARPAACRAANLSGVHFAMEFLPQQNKVVAGDTRAGPDPRHRQARRRDRRRRHRVATASARRTARAPRRSRSSSCCRSRPTPRTSRSCGRTGRSSCARRRRTRKAAQRDWAVATKRFEGRDGKVEKLVGARASNGNATRMAMAR